MFSKPDYIILMAAFVSFLFSISLWFGVFGPDNRDAGIFVGLWAPTFLILSNRFDRYADRLN